MRRQQRVTASAVLAVAACLLPATMAHAEGGAGPERTVGQHAQTAADRAGQATLAVDPTDARRLLATGPRFSADGGETFTDRTPLAAQSAWRTTGLLPQGDALLAYGPRPDASGGFTYRAGARAYAVSRALTPTGATVLTLSFSDDDGVSWSAPRETGTTSSQDLDDSVRLVVDVSALSPAFGQVYIVTTAASGEEAVVSVAVSRDGGATLDVPVQLSSAGGQGIRRGAAATIAPNGSISVGFRQGQEQLVSTSRDAGRTWTRPAPIATLIPLDDPVPGTPLRGANRPTLAADPRVGTSTLYAAWSTRTPDGGRIVLARSTDEGLTWSAPVQLTAAEGYALAPEISVSATGRVDLAYLAVTDGPGGRTVQPFVRSSDEGILWSQAVAVSTPERLDPQGQPRPVDRLAVTSQADRVGVAYLTGPRGQQRDAVTWVTTG